MAEVKLSDAMREQLEREFRQTFDEEQEGFTDGDVQLAVDVVERVVGSAFAAIEGAVG
jgi:hypothetical protein